MNHRSVSRWENGVCLPDLSLLEKISTEMNVSISEILEGQKAGSFLINEAVYFENYQQLMEINRKQVLAEIISDEEKQRVVQQLLSGVACQKDLIRYKKRMRVNPESDELYPYFYIPPYHGGKKLRLIQGYLPQTHLLYANHYELEILRLLSLFAPDHEAVMSMISRTESRLKNTCFGVSCTVGDCFIAGISVLRFLAAARSDDTEWIYRLMEPLGKRFLSFGTGRRQHKTVSRFPIC